MRSDCPTRTLTHHPGMAAPSIRPDRPPPRMPASASGRSPRATIRPDPEAISLAYGPVPRRRLAGRDADYALGPQLGEGGMGVVVEARQHGLDRPIALKRLAQGLARDPERRRRFLREASLTGRLDHPNILPVYELAEDEDGLPFYAMKRVQGQPWHERMAALPEEENLDILMHVADAVAYAHARGVVHLDLKSENVLIGEFGEVLLADWGLACTLDDLAQRPALGATAAGSPAYMAPEQARAENYLLGPATDIYLLGAILWEIATGQPPHPGLDVEATMLAAAENRLEPAAAAGELAAIARQAMAEAPAARFPEVRSFQAALRGYRAHARSRDLEADARVLLARARNGGSHSDYARGLHALEEAVTHWPENPSARAALAEARREYAAAALTSGDLDLAGELAVAAGDDRLRMLVAESIALRARRRRRMRTLTVVVPVLAILLFASVTAGLLLVRGERDRVVELARARDAAEIRLAREEAERARRERRAWHPVVHEDFLQGTIPAGMRGTEGAWRGADGALVASGPGPAALAYDAPLGEDLHVQFDLLAGPLRLRLGLRDAGPVIEVRVGAAIEAWRGQQLLGSAAMPAGIAGLAPRLRIDREGSHLRVLVDGRLILDQAIDRRWFAAAGGLELVGEPGATLDNLRIDRPAAIEAEPVRR